ncbi:MAG: polymer-forming cytoskeletal protein [Ruminiclostridium sp.]|nr:polymer-forming cytoskeletal protein [Ruminiclostridium sp.]
MGIKDNFQQALRELTGTEKEEPKQETPINTMKNAVSADTGEFDAIRGDSDGSSFEEIERRAAAAADEYSRQQSAYTSGVRSDSGTGNDAPYSQSGTAGGYGQQQYESSGYRDTGYTQQNVNGFQTYGQSDMNQQNNTYTRPGSGNQASSAPAAEQYRVFNNNTPAADEDEITIISKNTVIDGNVRSFANMSIDGNIKGNIETTKDMNINGKIVGNIACNNAKMRTSQIQGNIQMKGNAVMDRDTLLIGDLTSTYANVNGKIKGNLDITGKAELKSDAVVFGDISASTITVNDGAIIQGYVSTTFLNKEESKNIFPDTITIGE